MTGHAAPSATRRPLPMVAERYYELFGTALPCPYRRIYNYVLQGQIKAVRGSRFWEIEDSEIAKLRDLLPQAEAAA